MKRLFALAPLLVFAGLLAVLAYYNFHKKPKYEPDALVGHSVPALAIADLDSGGQSDLKTLVSGYDRPVLVNVFASWCAPCVAENPTLMALKHKGVVMIGVAWKDEPQNTLKFLAEHDNPYAHTLSDLDGRMGLELGISGVPETYVVQPDGTISDKISGPILPNTVGQVEAALGLR
jgi:cytochrome c biogenesis protein CcmG, thiol:disulfide interchange protein DsbE